MRSRSALQMRAFGITCDHSSYEIHPHCGLYLYSPNSIIESGTLGRRNRPLHLAPWVSTRGLESGLKSAPLPGLKLVSASVKFSGAFTLIYAALRPPRKRWITRKITAKTSRRWIMPPAMWNASHPTPHTPNKMKNKTRNRKSRSMLFLALLAEQPEVAPSRLNSTRLDAFSVPAHQ
jgi:hypothetical protein